MFAQGSLFQSIDGSWDGGGGGARTNGVGHEAGLALGRRRRRRRLGEEEEGEEVVEEGLC